MRKGSSLALASSDCVGGLRNATVCCGCICVASFSSGTLGPFTPVDPEGETLHGNFNAVAVLDSAEKRLELCLKLVPHYALNS